MKEDRIMSTEHNQALVRQQDIQYTLNDLLVDGAGCEETDRE